MSKFRFIVHFILLLSVPSASIFPQETYHIQTISNRKLGKNFRKEERYPLLTYNQILSLLNEIETGKAEKKYRKKDLRKINHFLAFLANRGELPNAEYPLALQTDVNELLSSEYGNFFENEEAYIALYESLFCSISWKKTKKFVEKYKKEIIIGAVVVVAIAVVIATVANSPSVGTIVAGTAGGVALSGSSLEGNDNFSSKEKFSSESPDIGAIDEAPILKSMINEQISSFKEFVVEDAFSHENFSQEHGTLSFIEKLRETGSYLAHSAFEEVTELVGTLPKLGDEIRGLSTKVLPEGSSIPSSGFMGISGEHYEGLVTNGHRAIDTVFSTDQAELFSVEAKANQTNSFIIGLIPLPASVSKIFSDTDKLLQAGKVLDRAGFTKAGRGLMKHGYRRGSVFPKPLGNSKQINEQGQKMLESIINHPERQISYKSIKNLGEIVDIHAPEIGGVRYNAAGELIGFLEP